MSKNIFSMVIVVSLTVLFIPCYACEVPDNGTGTADLPPQGCSYECQDGIYHIIDGLPPGTEILINGMIDQFFNVLTFPGGTQGGEIEQFDAIFNAPMEGTGQLIGFNRNIFIQIDCETHSGPRNPGDPVQQFATDWYSMQGQIFGDPDFDQLYIYAGTDLGLPSPGETTLTELPSGDFAVDSFFDISYRIDFVGAPGGALDGLSGSTKGTVRMATPGPVYSPVEKGIDYWLTHYSEFEFGSGDLPAIPADFFGPGSDPFDGVVAFKGVPADPSTNTLADTIVRRADDAIMFDPPAPIDIEILELNLVSTRPVKVTYNGGITESFFDVFVELDPTGPSPGQMTISKDDDFNGEFAMEFTANLLFNFEEQGSGIVYSLVYPLPAISQLYPWQVDDPELRVRPGCEVPGFYPSGGDVMHLVYGSAGLQDISEKPIPGDTDLDNDVDMLDLVRFASHWLLGK